MCIEGHEGDPYAGCSMRASKCHFLLSLLYLVWNLKKLLSGWKKAKLKCFIFLQLYTIYMCVYIHIYIHIVIVIEIVNVNGYWIQNLL